MANQNAKIDANRERTLLGVTDDASAEVRRLLVDPSTGRLLVSAVISSSTPKTSVTPTGDINGVNKTFTLPEEPSSGTLRLYKNGMRMSPTIDYSITTDTITMVEAPVTDSILLADYFI